MKKEFVVDFQVGDKILVDGKVQEVTAINKSKISFEGGSIDCIKDDFKLASNDLKEGEEIMFRTRNYQGKDLELAEDMKEMRAKVISTTKQNVICLLSDGREIKTLKTSVFRVRDVCLDEGYTSDSSRRLQKVNVSRGGVRVGSKTIPYSCVNIIPFSKIMSGLKIEKVNVGRDREKLLKLHRELKKIKGVKFIDRSKLQAEIKRAEGSPMYRLVTKKGKVIAETKQRKQITDSIINHINNQDRQSEEPKRENLFGFTLEKDKGIYTRANQIFGLQRYLKDRYPTQARRPKSPMSNKANFVGIEIEQFSKVNRGELEKLIDKNGLGKYLSTAEDGSLRPESDMFPLEIRLMCKEEELQDVVTRTCDLLSKAGSRVNFSCGMHVHLDMRNRNPSKCFSRLIKSVPQMKKCMTNERLTNSYAKDNKFKTFREAVDREDRYSGINASAYKKHKTIEVRYYQGCNNAKEILAWVNFLVGIVDNKKVLTQEQELFLEEHKKTIASSRAS